MKIDKYLRPEYLDQMGRQSPGNPTAADAFKTHFENALGATESKPSPPSPTALGGLSAAVNLPRNPSACERAAVTSFENLLASLTTYQERLGDGRFNLRMLASDLDRISGHCRQLDALTQELASDDALLPMLKEGLTTARMELERFQRGDYC